MDLKNQQQYLIKRTTKYETFTAPRTANGRRHLALVHPLSQLGISLLITQHRAKIAKLIRASGVSLYRTDEDPQRAKAFKGLDFRRWDEMGARICSECAYVLKADISRFFYTVYTHSIPWAVLGKEKAKDWLVHNKTKLANHWSSALDAALQSCQSRETFGIPVGPDTSRIIAEILMAGIEADKEFASCTAGRVACRLVDDFLIGFDNEDAARRALGAWRSALWKFNLQLNDYKTSVLPSRSLFREKWKCEFDTIVISASHPKKQRRDIYRLIDLTLHHCLATGSGEPATWACQRLSTVSHTVDNFTIIVDALFRLARDFPSCTSHVAAFLINNQSRCDEKDLKARIARWVTLTLKTHLPHSHEVEVAWCLVVAGVFRISIGSAELTPIGQPPNSVVFAMLGMLRERRLLSVPLSKWGWRAKLKKSGIYGENWLPFYEAVRRGWTNDRGMISAVKSDPLLAKMLAAKVTFLEDQVFDAARIDISRRVFTKMASKTAGPVRPGRRPEGRRTITLTYS